MVQDDDESAESGQGSEEVLAATEVLFREAALALAQALTRLRAGEMDEAKAALQAAKDLKAALQMVMDERTRLEKLRKQIAGGGGGSGGGAHFDLAAARAEIGRRLARLREAGGGA